MLELKKISKIYKTDSESVTALNNINLVFRENEFVSILGPSGCGKTTLLNIVGGLDKYTDGDLIINGTSTKKYKDKDWDIYRNHKIGFIFQSYNLIMHQTVLKNVELALTLSGVSKKERRKRAIKALEDVGLKTQLNKKPNQMSGGQMQRVAIARALVNNPDIILADEPTGALDSDTSVQIMEILKNIAKQKLIIMVTHNDKLAEDYSNRVIKLLDGKIINDSNPVESNIKEEEVKGKKLKTSMNFLTAFSLSLNNLLTKKGRTILTSFAGSIGIIGIALILSLSNGVDNYINSVQKDTLSTYPITINETTIDTSSIIMSLMEENQNKENKKDKVYSNDIMGNMIDKMTSKIQTNNLEKFKSYLDNNDKIKNYVSSIQYGYDIDLQIYKQNKDSYFKVNPTNILSNMNMDNPVINNFDIWEELFDNEKLMKEQYDLLKGKWPTNYNEVVLIVDSNNEISDYALYALGIKDIKELNDTMASVMKGEKISVNKTSYTYDDLLKLEYKLIGNTDYYSKAGNRWINNEYNVDYMNKVINKGLTIKVVGIIRPNDERTATSMKGSIGYLNTLIDYVSKLNNDKAIIKDQLNNKNINVFTGTNFKNAENIQLNLKQLGYISKENPSFINIYAKDFDSKNKVQDLIEEYNNEEKKNNREENAINYTDVVGVMINSVSSIVNTISYVLIAFVTISLIVSSIMIGIITYISVLERTKEIGILRAIGASKKDVSRVFNAETMIIGLFAGIMGILVTLGLNSIINIVISNLTNISNLSKLPLKASIVLILISVSLTFIAGLIPSRVASKKDPVEALRCE